MEIDRETQLWVIDDNDSRREAVVEIAHKCEIQPDNIQIATNFQEGYTLLHEEPADLAVVDMNLDETLSLDGLKLIKLIQETHRHCITIGITSGTSIANAARALRRNGPSDFIDCGVYQENWTVFLEQRIRMWDLFIKRQKAKQIVQNKVKV